MLCDTTGGAAIAQVNPPVGSYSHFTLYVYITTLPNVECTIAGQGGSVLNLRLQTDGTLRFYDGATLKITGTTVIPNGGSAAWTRISVTYNTNSPYTAYLWINGALEGSAVCAAGGYFYNQIGLTTSCTAKIYFDDFASSDDAGRTTDLGDIRCAAVTLPNAAGQYATFTTSVPVQTHYLCYDDPAGTSLANIVTDYAQQTATAATAEVANLNSSAQIGLVAADVIDAVEIMIYCKGAATMGIRVRKSTTDYDTAIAPSGSDQWLRKYYATNDPAGVGWSQATFDAFQAGCYCASHATDTFLYSVMVFVAYHADYIPFKSFYPHILVH